MFQVLVDSPKNLTEADLASIVTNASFLWERLNSERFVVDDNPVNGQEISRRLARWCEVVGQGNWETLQKRLQWEGLDLETVRPRLGEVKLVADQPLPEWAETLRQVIQTATECKPEVEVLLSAGSKEPIPFEDILLPFIKVARDKLLTRLGFVQLTSDNLPLSVLSTAAYCSLERSLLQQLSGISSKTLDFEFSQVRPFGRSLLSQLGLKTEDNHYKTHYQKFIDCLLQDGLLSFFQKYPVLGRLMTITLDFWVEFIAEFCQRLAADWEDIQQVFGATACNLPGANLPLNSDKITEITTSLSDPHNQGQSVILLTFESGLKVVYKPKDLGLEVAFTEFLDWCNCHSQLLDFKVIRVLNREGYGWVEYIEQQPCADEAAAQRFYQRAGMLLCLLYALRGTDCHNENLIANGEHLVLVDMETLLHHESHLIEDRPELRKMETIANQTFLDSVLRTGLLPNWSFSPDNRIAYDISGLGSTDLQQVPRKVLRWQSINTDDMRLRYETMMFPLEKNVPFLNGEALSPNDYQAQITAGFEQMYRFLMAQQHVLLASASPLAAMNQQQVRFVFRPTQVYGTISQKSLAPDYLKHGVDYSIELDILSRAFLIAQEKPSAWLILKAEMRAMEQLDIPFFSANTASDGLNVEDKQEIRFYFKEPSYDRVLGQLQGFDETDLVRQVGIIQGSLYAKVARVSTGENEKWETASLPFLTSEQLIQEAQTIASEIAARAIQDPDGSINWIGLGYVPEAERFQLRTLNNSLYDGRCGVALFLAALDKVVGGQQYHDLALAALQSLRQIKTYDAEFQQRFARSVGIGAATGLGSIVYTLVRSSQFLEDETLLQDAQIVASWITPERIAADQQFDTFGGSAGAILGLLSLYAATGEIRFLEQAIACGQHLLVNRVSYEDSPRAWQTTPSDRLLAGFSHGAAGIAYTLLRLYTVTQDNNYLEAALEGIEYERSIFSESACNWPDFRMIELTGQPSFVAQWCHGASGVGLGRLGSLDILRTPAIEQEIEVALQTTQKHGLQKLDHVCCGNLGRAEILLVGSQRCSRPDWGQVALQQATDVVARAKQNGAYQLFSNLPNNVFSPGFFQGISGIGYELLRLASSDLPSVLLWE